MKDAKLAAKVIADAVGTSEVGMILGSGLAETVVLEDEKTVSYEKIPGFLTSTAPGHKSEWATGLLAGKRVSVMRGRFHYYEGYDPSDIVFPIRVMKELGIKTVILTNAAGAVNLDFEPGDLMAISDHISFSGKNPLIGPNDDAYGPRFPDLSTCYDKELRALAKKSAARLGITLREGVYMWFSGPCYETPAEVRMARILGADAVGMSTVPEVIAARHAGLRVLGISCLSNMAAGILQEPLSHEDVTRCVARVKDGFIALITDIVANL